MAVNIEELRESTTNAILEIMRSKYENADVAAMRDFAAMIAQAAVSAVQHVIDRAQTQISGEGLQ